MVTIDSVISQFTIIDNIKSNMDYNKYYDFRDYGPFLEHALRYEHTRIPQPPEYVYELPLEIEVMILDLSGIEWWSLSKEHFKFFMGSKPLEDIMNILRKVEKYDNKNNSKHLDMMRPYYVNSIGEDKLKDADPLERFKFYLYKYGYEVCIGGLSDMLHLFLNKGITKELCEQVVETLTMNGISLIPEFVANCYFLEVKVSIIPETAHTLFYNIWNRCNYIHGEKSQDEITVCLNAMFDSIDFVPETNDLGLMFLLLNMSQGRINNNHVKLMKLILSMITNDLSEQLAMALEIPINTVIPETNYQGFPDKLSFGYVERLIDPILTITSDMVKRIIEGLENLQKEHRFTANYKLYQKMVGNSSILQVLGAMMGDITNPYITNPCIYTMVCDTFIEPIEGWNPDLYFEGCREIQKRMNPPELKVKFKTELLDTDYTYVKFMSEQEIRDILDRPLNYVSIYGIRMIFESGLSKEVISSDDLTKWVIRTCLKSEWPQEDEYGNKLSSVINDYMKIVNSCDNTPALIKILSSHQYISSEHFDLPVDIKYEIMKRKSKSKYYRVPQNDELVDMILEKQEPTMVNKLFESCSSCETIKDYLHERIKIYNSNIKYPY